MPKLIVAPPALIDAIGATLTVKAVPTCRIKWKGEYIQTESGKCVWRTRGHARSAFRHHLDTIRGLPDLLVSELGVAKYSRDYSEAKTALIEALEASGILRFEAGT